MVHQRELQGMTATFSRWLFLATMLACSIIGWTSQVTAQQTEQPTSLEIDPALILQAKTVWEVIGNDENRVWPGWDARSTPIMFYLPDVQEILINHPSPPADFVAYRGPLESLFPNMMVKDGETSISFDGQNTSRVMFGEQTLIVADTLSNRKNWLRGWANSGSDVDIKLADLNYRSLRANPYSQIDMIAHEAFHVFQYKHLKRDLQGDSNVRYYPCLSVENNVAFALEGEAISNALAASDPEEVRRYALQWLALRKDRRSALSRDAIVFEDENEFMEGLATYAGLACLEELQGTSPSDALFYTQGFHGFDDLSWYRKQKLQSLRGFMRGEIVVNNDLYGSAPVRQRLYYSGLGIALMLDRLSPQKWKVEIAAPEATLTQLVVTALSPTDVELSRALKEARDTPELKELYQAKETLKKDGQADTERMLGEIVDGPYTLLEMDWSDFTPEQMGLSYTAFGIRAIDHNQVIYTLVPIQAAFKDESGGFQQTIPRPTYQDSKRRLFQFQLTEKLEPATLVEKLGPADQYEWQVENLDLELPGATVTAKSAFIRFLDGKLTIKIVAL